MVSPPDEPGMKTAISTQHLPPGMYSFPKMQPDLSKLSAQEQAAEMEKINASYKQGPSGILIIAPTGEDPMSAKQLVGEFVADVGAALVASILMFSMRPSIPFLGRWVLLMLLAPLSWLSLTVSYWLWYRFSIAFVLDGLYCAWIEWAVAGLLIAAIARPPVPVAANT